nr:zeta toxin family protein [Bordetella sp. LUAb4]
MRVVIMAGPNGSGKTSVIGALQDEHPARRQESLLPDLIINPDIVRKLPETLELARTDGSHPDRAAQRVAYLHRQRAMETQQPFAFETVMSHPSKLAELAELRAAGYSVQLIFVTTKHPDINVRRVAYRVRSNTTTGHDVPENKTRERYERTMALLPAAIEHANESRLYDNSYDGQLYTRQASIAQEDADDVAGTRQFRIVLTATPENWVRDAINALQLRQVERDQYRAYATGHGLYIQPADTVHGIYQGLSVDLGSSNFFGIVAENGGRPTLTLHDFLSFTTQQSNTLRDLLNAGDLSIAYSKNNEPKIGLRRRASAQG